MKMVRALRAQQRFDGAALVHSAVALRHLREGQLQVKDLARVDFLVPYEVDQRGQVAAHGSGTAVEVNVGEEQFHAVELDPMRNTDVGDVPTGPCGADRLHHRFLCPDALKYRVG